MRTIIRKGKIITSHYMFYGDICIEEGIITKVDTELKEDGDKIIDASGKLVIPGGVDVHTHFNLHTANAIANDDFYTGTVAAACGGTTCVVDHMGFGPEGCALDHQLKVYHEYANGNAVIDYSFHGVIQHVNDEILEEMEKMVNSEGITSFKMYMTYDFKVSDEAAYRVLEKLKKLGAVTAVHAENDAVISYLRKKFLNQGKTAPFYHPLSRPIICEGEAVSRIINAARRASNAPVYIVHLSSELGLKYIKVAQNRGENVYSETCPQYLLLDEGKYSEPDGEGLKYIMSPPLRSKRNCEALWKGIREGNIQVVATDHCPFSFNKDKQQGRDDFTKCPNGAPGIEERIPLMFSEGVMKGRIGINKFVEVCCTNPAKIFGLYPRKGSISPGSDGDIVIIDPEKIVTLTQGMLHSNVDYTAYEGFQLEGYPVLTLSRGEVIVQDNEFMGAKGRGQFIKRNLHSALDSF